MKKILSILLIGFTFSGSSQTCADSILIQIQNERGNKIAGASAELTSTHLIKVSNANGEIIFYQLCNTNYTFQISAVGYETQNINIKLPHPFIITIQLKEAIAHLDEVRVTAVKENSSSKNAKVKLKSTEVESTRALGIAQALQQVSGVNLLSSGPTVSKPIIHGLHSNRILMLNNGVRQEGQNWGTEHAPEIDAFIANQFTVIKGAEAVRYGADAIAGVILAEPKPLFTKHGWQGEVNQLYYSNNRMGVISGIAEWQPHQLDNWAFRLQGTFKKAGNFKTPQYYVSNTGLQEANGSFTLGYRKNQFQTELFASAFNTTLGFYPGAHVESKDDLDRAIQSKRPLFPAEFSYTINRPRQEVQHYILKSNSKYKFNNKNQLQILLAYQHNNRSEYDAKQFINNPEMSLSLGTMIAELNAETVISNHYQIQNGVHYLYQENINTPQSLRIFIPNYINQNFGAFSIHKWRWNSMAIDAGIRFDSRSLEAYQKQNNTLTITQRRFNNFSGSLGTSIPFSKALEWNLNIGTAWRAPAINELFANGLHQGLAAIEVGNPNFVSEVATNVSSSFNWQKDSLLDIEITLYSNHINHFIYLQPVQPPSFTIRGYYPTFQYMQTNAVLNGLDFAAHIHYNHHWQSNFKFATVRARDRRQKDWLILMPADRAEADLQFNFNNQQWKDSYIKLGVLNVWQQKRVPNAAASVLQDYAAPPAGYFLLNLDASTTFQIKHQPIQLGLSVFNILNTTYRDYLNRFRYFFDEAGTNIALRLKIPFTTK